MTARASGSAHGSAGRLDSAAASPTGVVAWYAQGFADRLGDRLLLFDNTGAPPLELLRLAQRLTTDPAFEPALRERVEELKPFRHPAFARVRGVNVLAEPTPQLALVSDHIPGERLSQILRAARAAGFRPDPGTALWLVRQLMPAVAALHEMGAEIAHGTLSPDRIVVTPTGDLVVTEYVFAHALGQIDAGPAELWRELGVAVSDTAGRPDQRGDIEQVALLALAVLLGRPLGPDEYPRKVRKLLDEACDPKRWSLVPPLRAWLTRALALNAPFSTAVEALDSLDELLPRVSGMWAARLLPQNVAVPAGAPLAPAPGPPRAAARERALPPPPGPRPPEAATNPPTVAGDLDGGTPPPAPRAETPAAPVIERPAAREDGEPRRIPTIDATAAMPTGAIVAAPAGTDRRLWVVCLGVTGVALLEAICLVLLLGSGRADSDSRASAPQSPRAGQQPGGPAPAITWTGADDGWVTIESPVSLDVRVGGRVVASGTTVRIPAVRGAGEITITPTASTAAASSPAPH